MKNRYIELFVNMQRKNQLVFGKLVVFLTMFIGSIVLTGCGAWSKKHFIIGSLPSDYRSKYPISVSQGDEKIDIAVLPNLNGLSIRDRHVVAEFAAKFRRMNGKTIRIMIPSKDNHRPAVMRVMRHIAKVLKDENIPSKSTAIMTYNSVSKNGTGTFIRLAYSTLVAYTNTCGNWDDNLLNHSDNRNYSNFGCATQNNLAAIIANPADLIGPRGVSEIDPVNRNSVINTYRRNQ